MFIQVSLLNHLLVTQDSTQVKDKYDNHIFFLITVILSYLWCRSTSGDPKEICLHFHKL